MYLTRSSLHGWLTSAALLLAGSVAGAQAPAPAARTMPPKAVPAAQTTSPKAMSPADLKHRQVLTRQVGFEAQQMGYLAKVQGASSQKVLWVKTPPPQSKQRSSLSALLGSLFED